MRRTALALTMMLFLAACSAGETGIEQSMAGEPSLTTTAAAAEDAEIERGSFATDQGLTYAPPGQKVIVTSRMQIQAADTRRAMEEITALVESSGGFVAAAQVNPTPGEQEQPAISLTLRIPSGQLSGAMAAIRTLADEVVSESLDSQDVTEEYVDLEARLSNLRALETELRALLAEVREQPGADPEKLLRVFSEISSVRGQIEQLEGRLRFLDDRVMLSTLTVTISPLPSTAPLVDEGWEPLLVAREALRSLVGAFQTVADAAIWLALFALPLLAAISAPVWGGYLAWRRWRRNRPAALDQPASSGDQS